MRHVEAIKKWRISLQTSTNRFQQSLSSGHLDLIRLCNSRKAKDIKQWFTQYGNVYSTLVAQNQCPSLPSPVDSTICLYQQIINHGIHVAFLFLNHLLSNWLTLTLIKWGINSHPDVTSVRTHFIICILQITLPYTCRRAS